MHTLRVVLGRLSFWAAWPAIWLYIQVSPPRTRVVIVHDNKVLLLKVWLSNGRWLLPGGGLHRGEDPVAGAIREVQEETGIKLKNADLRPLITGRVVQSGIATNCIGYVVSLHVQPEIMLQKYELIDHTWQPLDTVATMPLDRSAQAMLTAYRAKY